MLIVFRISPFPTRSMSSDLYRIISELAEKGVAFRVVDDPSIDTTSRTGKLVMGILALIAEFENDIRRERQMDGIAKAKERGIHFGRKRELTAEKIAEIKSLRQSGITVHHLQVFIWALARNEIRYFI